MKSIPKNTSLMLLWLAGGILSWVLSMLLFSYLLSPFVTPTFNYLKETFGATTIFASAFFIFTHAADYSTSFLFTMMLSFTTGMRSSWVAGFVVGATAYTIYISMDAILFYSGYYGTLPSWAIQAWLQSMISSLVIIPLLAWAGARVGILIKQKKTSSDIPGMTPSS